MLKNPKITKITSFPQTPKEPWSSPKLVDFGNMHQLLPSVKEVAVVSRSLPRTRPQHSLIGFSMFYINTKVLHHSMIHLKFCIKILKITLLGKRLFKNSLFLRSFFLPWLLQRSRDPAFGGIYRSAPCLHALRSLSLPGQPGNLKQQCMLKQKQNKNPKIITTKNWIKKEKHIYFNSKTGTRNIFLLLEGQVSTQLSP